MPAADVMTAIRENALSHGSDIAEVQEWLGQSSISTTRLYDNRKLRPEDSPTLELNIDIARISQRPLNGFFL